MLNLQSGKLILWFAILFLVIGCGSREDTKQAKQPVKQPEAAPPPKKVVEPKPELTEAQKRALEEKKAEAKRKVQELEKMKAACAAEEKVKKQLDDSRKVILDSPERTGHLRKYRGELEKVKEFTETIKSLKMRIGDIDTAGDPGMQTIRTDLADQLDDLVRQLPEANRKARFYAAYTLFGLPQNLRLSDEELTKLAFSLRGT